VENPTVGRANAAGRPGDDGGGCSTQRVIARAMLLVAAAAIVFTLTFNFGGPSARARVGKLQIAPDSVVLVTGGAGFIGYHLSLRLKKERATVIALDSFTPYYSTALKRARAERLRAAGVELVEGDMCDEEGLKALIAARGVTHVASLAAQAGVRYSLVNPQSYVRSNVQCFLSLLEALRETPHVPLIYASSSSIYGSNTKAPFAETDRVDSPNSLYAATKKANIFTYISIYMYVNMYIYILYIYM